MRKALKEHWPEYLIEAWCLATFMVSASFFGVLFFSPASPLADVNWTFRNLLMGVAMGSSAIAVIKSPFGKRSGAHFNPAVTLTFLRLGKINSSDATFYILFQLAGGVAGVLASWLILGRLLADDPVNFVVTVPGSYGLSTAFAAEAIISFLLMAMILFATNSSRTASLTPIYAGCMVALYIAIESPVSGTSMNPARTFASSVVAGDWTGWWIYFTAPPLAMLAAAEFFVRTRGLKSVLCAKLDHFGASRCIFNCSFDELGNHATGNTAFTEQTGSWVKTLSDTSGT